MNLGPVTAIYLGCLFFWGGPGSSNYQPLHSAATGTGESSVGHSVLLQVRQSRSSPGQRITKDRIRKADVSVLLIGNSHAAPIPILLTRLFQQHVPDSKVLVATAPSWGFLAEHANRNSTISLIKRGPWDYVILQAQKYSTTGKYTYPYDGALKLSNIATERGAKIIMFPEWSRREVPDEYKRINKLHEEIANQTGAVVAPIGQAWRQALQKEAKLKLHAKDGNHATSLGSYLNACVFYSMVTGNDFGNDPELLNPSNNSALKHLIGDDSSTKNEIDRRLLQQTAWSEVKKVIDAGQLKIKTAEAPATRNSK